MKSLNGKVLLGVACAGLMISLMAGNAFAADRDGGRRGGSASYNRGDRGGDRGYDRDRGYSRYDRGDSYRPHYAVRDYRPVYFGRSYYYEPDVVYVAPAVEYYEPAPVVEYYRPAPVCRSTVVVRSACRSRGWGVGVGFYFGR
jgi:hypothetical protein